MMPQKTTEREKPPYGVIFDEIFAGLMERFPTNLIQQKPEYEHSTPNRMRIYLQGIKVSHYEICFRQAYYEFALHFESTPARDLERRQAFDPQLQAISEAVGVYVKSGKLENKGRMRVWYELPVEPITQEKIIIYIEQYSKFITATLPTLVKIYKV